MSVSYEELALERVWSRARDSLRVRRGMFARRMVHELDEVDAGGGSGRLRSDLESRRDVWDPPAIHGAWVAGLPVPLVGLFLDSGTGRGRPVKRGGGYTERDRSRRFYSGYLSEFYRMHSRYGDDLVYWAGRTIDDLLGGLGDGVRREV